MEKEKFRLPCPSDVLPGVTKARYYTNYWFWGCFIPIDKTTGLRSKFCYQMVADMLFYGFRIISEEGLKKDFEVVGKKFENLEYVLVESLHGSKFYVFSFEDFIAVEPLEA